MDLKKNWRISVAMALVIILLYCTLHFVSKPLEKIQFRSADFFIQLRNSYQKVPANFDQLVVVDLDEDSFRRLNLRWPYGRDVYAELIKRIAVGDPKLISFDFVFAGDDNPQSDALFSQAINDAKHVILAAMIGAKGELINSKEEFLKSALASGIINKPRDPDQAIRRARFFYDSILEGHRMWSWEALNAMAVLNVNPEQVETKPREVILKEASGSQIIPLLKDGTFYINFKARPQQIHKYSFWKVLGGQVSPQEFKDKIVLVGLTASGFHDIDDTPFGLIPGVYINANAIMTILNRDFMQHVPFVVDVFLIFLFVLISSLLAYYAKPHRSILGLFALVFSFVGFWIVLVHFNWIGDVVSAPFAALLAFVLTSLFRLALILIENTKLREEAIHDPLTKLFTRRFMEVKIRNEISRMVTYARRKSDIESDLCLIMADIDHFKSVNDTYGHQAGDQVLRNVAELFRQTLRASDIVARYGGEEICIILPSTLKKDAVMLGEKLRKKMEEGRLLVAEGYTVKITASFGVAAVREDNLKNYERLVSGADMALYHAKNSGRNRVCPFESRFGLELQANNPPTP